MRPLLKTLLACTVLILAACGSGSTHNPASGLVGSYSGDLVIGDSSPFVSEKVTFTVDAAGRVSGTTLGTNGSGKPGGAGTFSGTMSLGSTGLFFSYDLTSSSTDLGSYTIKGNNGQYSELIKQMGIQANATKSGAPTFSGLLVLSAQKN